MEEGKDWDDFHAAMELNKNLKNVLEILRINLTMMALRKRC